MQKQLIAIVVVVLVVVAAATAIVITQTGKRDVLEDTGDVLAAPMEQPKPAPAPVAPPPDPLPLPRVTSTDTPAKPTPTETAATPAATRGEGGEAERTRIKAMVDGMSEDDRRLVRQELERREEQARREAMRYMTASDMRLRFLGGRGGNSELRLSEDQQKQVQAVRDAMRPKFDAALGDVWSQSEQLRTQERTLREQGQDTSAIEAQRDALRQKEREIRQQLDTEFMTSVKGLLTPEQTQALESMPSFGGGQGNGRFGRDGRRGGDAGAAGGNTGGGN